jgi:DinB superfamily
MRSETAKPMTILVPTAPHPSEYVPYYERYISLVPNQDVLAMLNKQSEQTQDLLSGLSEQQASFRYAPGKWTIKQVLGHLIDAERVFCYRALRIARNDKTPMEGFEQDDYVANGPFESVSLAELLREYAAVRHATVLLFRHLSPEAWNRRGIANNNEVSVRATAYIIAGHELHHCRILREKYLPAAGETGKSVGQS